MCRTLCRNGKTGASFLPMNSAVKFNYRDNTTMSIICRKISNKYRTKELFNDPCKFSGDMNRMKDFTEPKSQVNPTVQIESIKHTFNVRATYKRRSNVCIVCKSFHTTQNEQLDDKSVHTMLNVIIYYCIRQALTVDNSGDKFISEKTLYVCVQ